MGGGGGGYDVCRKETATHRLVEVFANMHITRGHRTETASVSHGTPPAAAAAAAVKIPWNFAKQDSSMCH